MERDVAGLTEWELHEAAFGIGEAATRRRDGEGLLGQEALVERQRAFCAAGQGGSSEFLGAGWPPAPAPRAGGAPPGGATLFSIRGGIGGGSRRGHRN